MVLPSRKNLFSVGFSKNRYACSWGILEIEVSIMTDSQTQDKPYFCPNCRSNRVKFNVVTTYSQSFMKDAITGSVTVQEDPLQIAESEPNIQCRVCGFTGNELRFVKQAEREPRQNTNPGQGLQ